MAVLWDKERATVGEVVTVLKSRYAAAYSTVQTMLRILETKGYVKHEKSGRAGIYRPVIDQRQARRRALSHLVSRLFDNSPSLLVLNVLEDDQIEPAELERLKKLIHDKGQEE
jgi:predicted transcriptional regulator